MEAKIITINNEKGGVGKTTTAREVGLIISNLGFKTLFLDLDTQGNLTRTLTGNRYKTAGVYDFLKGNKYQVIKINENADIIPSTRETAGIYNVLTNFNILSQRLEPLKNKYAFIIIDTPASTTPQTMNAYNTSNYLIIPTEADFYTLDGFGALFENVKYFQNTTNKKIKVLGVLLTRFRSNRNISKEYREIVGQYAEKNGTQLFKTVIRENEDIKKASATPGVSIAEYKRRSNGANDYIDATAEILKAINEDIRKGE